jgi:hypothetical protein
VGFTRSNARQGPGWRAVGPGWRPGSVTTHQGMRGGGACIRKCVSLCAWGMCRAQQQQLSLEPCRCATPGTARAALCATPLHRRISMCPFKYLAWYCIKTCFVCAGRAAMRTSHPASLGLPLPSRGLVVPGGAGIRVLGPAQPPPPALVVLGHHSVCGRRGAAPMCMAPSLLPARAPCTGSADVTLLLSLESPCKHDSRVLVCSFFVVFQPCAAPVALKHGS